MAAREALSEHLRELREARDLPSSHTPEPLPGPGRGAGGSDVPGKAVTLRPTPRWAEPSSEEDRKRVALQPAVRAGTCPTDT